MHGGFTIRTDAPAAVGGMGVDERVLRRGESAVQEEEELAESELDVARLWRFNATFLKAVFHTAEGTTWLLDVLARRLVEVSGTVDPEAYARSTEQGADPLPQLRRPLRTVDPAKRGYAAARAGGVVAFKSLEAIGAGSPLRAVPEEPRLHKTSFELVSEAQRFVEVARTILAVSPVQMPLLCLPAPAPALCLLTLHGEFPDAPLRVPPASSAQSALYSRRRVSVGGEADVRVSRDATCDASVWVGCLDLNDEILPERADLSRWLPKGLDLYAVGLVGISESKYPDPTRLVYQILRHVGKRLYTLVHTQTSYREGNEDDSGGDGDAAAGPLDTCLLLVVRTSLLPRVSNPDGFFAELRRPRAASAAAAATLEPTSPASPAGGSSLRSMLPFLAPKKTTRERQEEVAAAAAAAAAEEAEEASSTAPSEDDAAAYAAELAREQSRRAEAAGRGGGDDDDDSAEGEDDDDGGRSYRSELSTNSDEAAAAAAAASASAAALAAAEETSVRSVGLAVRVTVEESDLCFVLLNVRLGEGAVGPAAVAARSEATTTLLKGLRVKGWGRTAADAAAPAVLLENPQGNFHHTFVAGSLGDEVLREIQANRALAAFTEGDLVLPVGGSLGYRIVSHSLAPEAACAETYESHVPWGTIAEGRHAVAAVFRAAVNLTFSEAFSTPSALHAFSFPSLVLEGGGSEKVDGLLRVCVHADFNASAALAFAECDGSGRVAATGTPLVVRCHTNTQGHLRHAGFVRFGVAGVGAGTLALRTVFDALWAQRTAAAPPPPTREVPARTSPPLPFTVALYDGARRADASLRVAVAVAVDSTPLLDAAAEKTERDEAARQEVAAEEAAERAEGEAEEAAARFEFGRVAALAAEEAGVRTWAEEEERLLRQGLAAGPLRLAAEEDAARREMVAAWEVLAALLSITSSILRKAWAACIEGRAAVQEEEAAAFAAATAAFEAAAEVVRRVGGEESAGRAAIEAEERAAARAAGTRRSACVAEAEARADCVAEEAAARGSLGLRRAEGAGRRRVSEAAEAAVREACAWQEEARRTHFEAVAALTLAHLAGACGVCAAAESRDRAEVLGYLGRDRASCGEAEARRLLREEEALWASAAVFGPAALQSAEDAAFQSLVRRDLPALLAAGTARSAAALEAEEAAARAAAAAKEAAAAAGLPLRHVEVLEAAAREGTVAAAECSARGGVAELEAAGRASAGDAAKRRRDVEAEAARTVSDAEGGGRCAVAAEEEAGFEEVRAAWNNGVEVLRGLYRRDGEAMRRNLVMKEVYEREELVSGGVREGRRLLEAVGVLWEEAEGRAGVAGGERAAAAEAGFGEAPEALRRRAEEEALLRCHVGCGEWLRGAARVLVEWELHSVDLMELQAIERVARTDAEAARAAAFAELAAEHAAAEAGFLLHADRVAAEGEARADVEVAEAEAWQALVESTVFPEWGDCEGSAALRAQPILHHGVLKVKSGAGGRRRFDERWAVLRGRTLSLYEEKRRLDLSFGCAAGTVPLSEAAFTVSCPGAVGSAAVVMQAASKGERDEWIGSVLGYIQHRRAAGAQTDAEDAPQPGDGGGLLPADTDALFAEADRRYGAVVSSVVTHLDRNFEKLEDAHKRQEHGFLEAKRAASAAAAAASPHSPQLVARAEEAAAAVAEAEAEAAGLAELADYAVECLEEKNRRFAASVSALRHTMSPATYHSLMRAASASPSPSPPPLQAASPPALRSPQVPHEPASCSPSPMWRRQAGDGGAGAAEGSSALQDNRNTTAANDDPLPIDLRFRSVSASPVPLREMRGMAAAAAAAAAASPPSAQPQGRGVSAPAAAFVPAQPAQQPAAPAMAMAAASPQRGGPSDAVELALMAQALQAAQDDRLDAERRLDQLSSDVLCACRRPRATARDVEAAVHAALDAAAAGGGGVGGLSRASSPSGLLPAESIVREDDWDGPQSPRRLRCRMLQRIEELEATVAEYEAAGAPQGWGGSAAATAAAATAADADADALAELAEDLSARLARSEAQLAASDAALSAARLENEELATLLAEAAAECAVAVAGAAGPTTTTTADGVVEQLVRRGTARLEDALDNVRLGLAPAEARHATEELLQAQRRAGLPPQRAAAATAAVVDGERRARRALLWGEAAASAALRGWAEDAAAAALRRSVAAALGEQRGLAQAGALLERGASPSPSPSPPRLRRFAEGVERLTKALGEAANAAAPPRPPSAMTSPGTVVRASNLVSTSYLNGKLGVAAGSVGGGAGDGADARLLVSFPAPYGEWALKECNLQAVSPHALPAVAPSPAVALVLREMAERRVVAAAETLERLALLLHCVAVCAASPLAGVGGGSASRAGAGAGLPTAVLARAPERIGRATAHLRVCCAAVVAAPA